MLLDHLGSFQADAPCPLLLSLDIRDYYSYHRLDASHCLYDDIFNSELQPRRHRQSSCSGTTSKDPTLEGSTKNPIHPASTDYYTLPFAWLIICIVCSRGLGDKSFIALDRTDGKLAWQARGLHRRRYARINGSLFYNISSLTYRVKPIFIIL